jgi:formate hydrogenlyase subunit 3/multisubunit Na+/H+ antiporter MnhD subunit
MSLASWALVMTHHREAENARAGFLYIVMASFGGIALLLCFGALAGAVGAFDFDTLRASEPGATTAALAFTLALIGAGSKAGIAPLHVWLPEAHPAAPSHVSALMSGAMTKVAVYAFVRIAFDLLGEPTWWQGLAVLAIGAFSALLGVLFAMLQTDMKRALAYSTIENVGFVFAGLGLAMAFHASNMPALAALAFTAALFHAFNHGLFKTLLFCGAGAVLAASGTRNLESLGGLIHRMPWTAGAFLVGAAAISALPPLNGFASEWLTLQAILLSPDLPQWPLKILAPGAGGVLALAAALAAACFVRIYGVAFLGRPRTAEAAAAKEVDAWSRAAMATLALTCLLVGLAPGVVVDALAGAADLAVGARMPLQTNNEWVMLAPVAESRSSYSPLLVFAFMLSSMGAAVLAIHLLASRAIRRAPSWDCGFPDSSPATQYTAGSMAQPTRRVFNDFVYRAEEVVRMPPPGDTSPAYFRVQLVDRVWNAIYAPISGLVSYAADKLNVLQFLTIRRYLGFVFASLIILLLGLALWP